VARHDGKHYLRVVAVGRIVTAQNPMGLWCKPLRKGVDEELLDYYTPGQQKVEHGFRFLKDPWFMANTLFLKPVLSLSKGRRSGLWRS